MEYQTMKRDKGFSLIELMVAVAIVGILAAVAIPSYLGVQKRSARTEAKTNLESLRLLQEQYFAENNDYTPAIAGGPVIGVAAIQGFLPGFQPGQNLNYNYAIRARGANGFWATATPVGGPVTGDFDFNISDQNVKIATPNGTNFNGEIGVMNW